MDMKNAFRHWELDRRIYMNQPNGFENEIRVISQYMQSSKKAHLHTARQILQYVKSKTDHGLLFKRSKDCKLARYCDADYARDHDTRRSITWYVFKLGSRIISCRSKK